MPTLKVWTGSEWEYLTGGAPILQQDAAPGSPVEGDLWIDTDATPSTVRDLDFKTRTSGNITLNSTSWANVDTGLDITLTGVATGDIIEVSLSAAFSNEAVDAGIDVATIVSGSPVNYFGTAGSGTARGIVAWGGVASGWTKAGGTYHYALQAGDISGGSVLLRLRYRTTAASNKTLTANADEPLRFAAQNMGPGL